MKRKLRGSHRHSGAVDHKKLKLTMEFDVKFTSSPYLTAIQQVPGSKPGEKYKNINEIAKRIVSDAVDKENINISPTEQYNELMVPLIKLEVAKIVHQPEVVAEALNSEDSTTFHRALRVKWFFDKTYDAVTCVDYFKTHIFPSAPLKNRFGIIRTLGANLKDETVAQSFYEYISDTYNHFQARPLLFNCNEVFIWEAILKNNIEFQLKEVEKFYFKYPNLILKYLHLNKTDSGRRLLKVPLHQYAKFLPKLLKKHPQDFVKLIKENNSNFSIKLTREYTDIFFKKLTNEFINNPTRYMDMTNLKMITAKLNKEQFKIFFKNMYPKKISYFYYDDMCRYLIDYPEKDKFLLITSTFETVYGVKFTSDKSRLTPSIMKQLTREERIEQARLLLVDDKEFPTEAHRLEYSWRCYLPTEESIPEFKAQLLKTQSADKRGELLKQIIFCCKMNDDQVALLDILTHITTKHKNESPNVVSSILQRLYFDFDIKLLNRDILKILFDFTQSLVVKNQMTESERNFVLVACYGCGIKHSLENNLPADENIQLLIKLNMRYNHSDWNMPKGNLQFERLFLLKVIELIPLEFCENYDTTVKKWSSIVIEVVYAIYDFQKRNIESGSKTEGISIRQYQYLLVETRKHLVEYCSEYYVTDRMKEILKLHEPELYAAWIGEKKEEKKLVKKQKKNKVLDDISTLKYNPLLIDRNFDKHFRYHLDKHYTTYTKQFIKALCWHQGLPIKFLTQCLEDLQDKEVEVGIKIKDLAILAMLLRGPEFESIIKCFIPDTDEVNTEDEDAQSKYEIQKMLPRLFNKVNPPISLDVLLPYFNGEFVQLGLKSLVSTCGRSSISKVILFAQELIKCPVAVKKHGVRLYCSIVDITSLRQILTTIWRKERHQSIHELVFQKIFKIFLTTPNANTWKLMSECIDGLNAKDEATLNQLKVFDKIPNEYISDFVDKLVSAVEKIHPDLEDDFYDEYIVELLKFDSSIAPYFSEDLHQKIIEIYLLNLSNPKMILSMACYYCIHIYFNICKDENLDLRLEYITHVFNHLISNHWNDSAPDESNFYPAQFVVKQLHLRIFNSSALTTLPRMLKLIEVVLKSVTANLKPHQAPYIYTSLLFASLFKNTEDFPKNVANILPLLSNTLLLSFPIISTSLQQVIHWAHSYLAVDGMESWNYGIIINLLKENNEQINFIVAKMMYEDKITLKKDKNYWSIIHQLRTCQNPSVLSYINLLILKLTN